MDTIETNRRRLLGQQTELRRVMTANGRFDKAMKLFFEQHASLHTAQSQPRCDKGQPCSKLVIRRRDPG